MGPVERGLLRQGLRYALGLRLVVTGASGSVSLLLVPAPEQAVTIVVVIALNVWNLCYALLRLRLRLRLRGARRPCRWLAPVDVAVICGVCLAQAWTVRSDPTGGATWVFIAMGITVVTYAWQLSGPALAAATSAIAAAYYVGTTLVAPHGWLANPAVPLWNATEAALSWGLYRLVRRGARTADRIVERGEQLRRAGTIAAARRLDEREYLAALHDTASATLLMVGGGVVAQRENWLAEQAKRDLQEIGGSDVAARGEVDLLDLLREVVEHTPLRVSWTAPESLLLPAVEAVSLSRGAREALTNVVRHAETDHADIHVRGDDDAITMDIIDEGKGFDPAQVADHRYGLTRSLRERMTRTGGSARIVSSPGRGTTVTMTCPRSVPTLQGDDAEIIAISFQRGLRWAVVVLSVAILLFLDMPWLLVSRDAYREVWPQYVTWGGLLAVTLVAAVATWRDRPLGRWRWPLLVLVFASSVLGTVSVRPEYLLGSAHWSEGDAGWQVVLLMLDSRVGVFVVVLAAQYLMTFGLAARAGQAAVSVAGAVNSTWLVLAYQIAIAMIGSVLRGLAVSSAKVARADEQLRTSEAVARHLHDDRMQRYAGLAATTVPLLEGLASGTLDPGEEPVRRSCAVEATRMRRMFAEDTAVSDPLSQELRACIELAERNGVSVSYAECGSRPALPAPVRRRLTGPAIAVLATTQGKVRLTIAGTRDTVTVSVIAAGPRPSSTPDGDGVRTSTVSDGDRVWIQATWHGGS